MTKLQTLSIKVADMEIFHMEPKLRLFIAE